MSGNNIMSIIHNHKILLHEFQKTYSRQEIRFWIIVLQYIKSSIQIKSRFEIVRQKNISPKKFRKMSIGGFDNKRPINSM